MHTSSVVSALKTAGLSGWRVQSRQGAGGQQAGRTLSQVLRTSNQFDLLN